MSFLKSCSKKLEASSFKNIELTGFYRLTKLHAFRMGQNAGVNKSYQLAILFSIQF